MNSHCDSATQ